MRARRSGAHVDAEDYQSWIDIGHALKHAFGEAGFSIWDRWSQKSAKYPGATQGGEEVGVLQPQRQPQARHGVRARQARGLQPTPRPQTAPAR